MSPSLSEVKKKHEEDSSILPSISLPPKSKKQTVRNNGNGGTKIHPSQAQELFFHDIDNMKYHLDEFLQQDDIEEKWEEVLTHIKTSDYDKKRKKVILSLAEEVLQDG